MYHRGTQSDEEDVNLPRPPNQFLRKPYTISDSATPRRSTSHTGCSISEAESATATGDERSTFSSLNVKLPVALSTMQLTFAPMDRRCCIFPALANSSLTLSPQTANRSAGQTSNRVHSSAALQIVAYKDRTIVVFDSCTRRLAVRQLKATEERAIRNLRILNCPLCGQTVDPRTFSLESESYFYLLQELINQGSMNTTSSETCGTNFEESQNPFHSIGPDDQRSPFASTSFTCQEIETEEFRKAAGSSYNDSRDAELNLLNETDFRILPISRNQAPNSAQCNQASHVEAEASVSWARIVNKDSSKLIHISPDLLVTGYYRRFFREIRKLGSGSYGQVFHCHHFLEDYMLGEFAVKKIPVGDSKLWFQNMILEVKIRERFHHPNVVEYKHSWLEMHRSSEFCPYIPWLFVLMEYCNGGDLEDLIISQSDSNASHTLPDDCVWSIFNDILLGLQHLHHSGIVHRDLKPSNILLQMTYDEIRTTYTTHALLADFGTAVIMNERAKQNKGRKGYTGTIEYTSPELLKTNEKGVYDTEYDFKSDMWSLGVILHKLAFNQCPFKAPMSDKDFELTRRHILNHGKFEPHLLPMIPQRSPTVKWLICALLSPNPQDRPSTDSLTMHPLLRPIIANVERMRAASALIASRGIAAKK